MEIQFDNRGRTVGAKTLTYLLEKSRVTHVPQGERSFHVFYYLANGSGAEDRPDYGLMHTAFEYLSRPGTVQRISDFSDSDRFQELVDAMGNVGLNQKYRRHIFTVLASILSLGNLQFQYQKNGEESSATVRNQDVADHVSFLLGLPVDALVSLFSARTKQVGSDKFTMYLDADGAAARRDDFARALYSLLFNWLVEFLNSKLCKDEDDYQNFIGIVDFPGWQIARHNSYEQLCSNYANERLHHFLFHQIFEAGNSDYADEGVATAVPIVSFPDRSICLDLFMKPRSGLFAIMDRQAAEYLQVGKKKRRGSSAQREFDANASERESSNQLLKAFNRMHDKRSGDSNPYYSPSESKNEMNSFAVSHFWGSVTYTIDDFVEKNLDQLSSDFVSVFRGDGSADCPGTDNSFVGGLFSSKTIATEMHPKDEREIVQAQAPSVPTRAPTMKRPNTRSATHVAKVDCVATQLQRALNEMVMTIDETLPWFVLCIKPNEQGRPRSVDPRRIQAQTSCFNLDTIATRKSAEYSAVLGLVDICQRYKPIIDEYVPEASFATDDYARAAALKTALHFSDTDMAVGRTKVFLSFAAWRRLDDPIRSMERMDMDSQHANYKGSKDQFRQHGGDLSPVVDGMDLSAASYGDQSEANLMLNAQPPGRQPSGADSASQHARALKGRMFGATGDVRSYYSDDDAYQDTGVRDGASDIMSDRGGFNPKYAADQSQHSTTRPESIKKGSGAAAQGEIDDEPETPATTRRKIWLAFVWACTWLVPSAFLGWCGRIKRRDQRIAWREKVALCMIIFWSCVFVIFWIVGLGLILCPKQHVYSTAELQSHNTDKDALIAIRGEVFDVKDFSHMQVSFDYLSKHNYLGRDLSTMFPYQLSFVCPFENLDPRLSFQYKPDLYSPTFYHDHRWWRHPSAEGYNYYQFRLMRIMRENHSKGHIAVDPKELKKEGSGNAKNSIGNNLRRCIIHGQIYDLSDYIASDGPNFVVVPDGQSNSSSFNRKFLDTNVVTMFDQYPGNDISEMWDNYFTNDLESKALHTQCLRGAFYVGK
ncbi:hypothetical protein GGI11_006905, partial [Coemansia sp. RSA 2049]